MKKRTIALMIGAIVLIALAGCGQLQGQAVTEQKEPVRIGLVTPLSGDAAAYGIVEQRAMAIALEKVNAEGGIGGHPLEMIAEDGKCAGQGATVAGQKLIGIDKVRIILGGMCSGESLALARLTEPAGVVLFSSASSHPALSKVGAHFFRNWPSDAFLAAESAKLVVNDGHKRVALITEQTEYATGFQQEIVILFKEERVTLVADEMIVQDATDARSQLLKVKAANPDAIFINTQTGRTGGMIAKQARELGLEQQLYSTYVMDGSDAIEAGGEAIEGIKFSSGSAYPASSAWLTEQYKARFGETPAVDYLAGARYDATLMVADALRACSAPPVDTDCVAHYLHSITYDGTIGTYGFDAHGDLTGISAVAKTVKDGAFVIEG